jgi:Polyketide cyclase / dehydrase and lipid transport.
MLDADRVEVCSSSREGVGVRLAVRTRIAGVPAFVEPMEVVGWEPPHRLTLRHGGLVEGRGIWRLDAIASGTRFTWTEDIRLHTPVIGEWAARGYAPVVRRLMHRAMARLRRQIIATGPDPLTPKDRPKDRPKGWPKGWAEGRA